MSFQLLDINDANIDNIPQIKYLFNKFIKKVIDDNDNYNILSKLKDNNNKKHIKLISIFLENNSIVNVSSTKIQINLENFEESVNNFLVNNNLLNNNYLKKILIYNFLINKDNIHNFLSFSYKNYNEFYKFQFVDFNILNSKIRIINNEDISSRFSQLSNKFFFIDDLDSIYFIFETKKILPFNNLHCYNIKTTKNKVKHKNNKTKKNKIKK